MPAPHTPLILTSSTAGISPERIMAPMVMTMALQFTPNLKQGGGQGGGG